MIKQGGKQEVSGMNNIRCTLLLNDVKRFTAIEIADPPCHISFNSSLQGHVE